MNRELKNQFMSACETNNLEQVITIYEKMKEKFNILYFIDGFQEACAKGNLDIVKYFTSHPEHPTSILTDDGRAFTSACKNGHLTIVEHLFVKSLHQAILTESLKEACNHNQLEIVKFLVTNADEYDIKKAYDTAYLEACQLDSPKMLKYLLEVFKNQDFNFGWGVYDKGFVYSCEKKTDVMNYFLYDLNFEYDSSVAKLIDKHTEQESEDILEYIKKRDLFLTLNKNLSPIKEQLISQKAQAKQKI